MDNHITDAANKFLLHRFDGDTDPDNPFYNEDEELYIRYDSIQIRNFNKVNGVGVEVGYYWKGVKMVVFPVGNIAINFYTGPNASKHIGLDGINGSMKMVLT